MYTASLQYRVFGFKYFMLWDQNTKKELLKSLLSLTGSHCLFCSKSCKGGNDPPPPAPAATIYDIRKMGHSLPMNNVPMYFEPLPNIPTGIFRPVDGEVLGLGAGKCCMYKNPEYFAYHHMTFHDMNLLLRCFRLPVPKTGRKP